MEASGKASGAGPRAVVIPAVPGLFISAWNCSSFPPLLPGERGVLSAGCANWCAVALKR